MLCPSQTRRAGERGMDPRANHSPTLPLSNAALYILASTLRPRASYRSSLPLPDDEVLAVGDFILLVDRAGVVAGAALDVVVAQDLAFLRGEQEVVAPWLSKSKSFPVAAQAVRAGGGGERLARTARVLGESGPPAGASVPATGTRAVRFATRVASLRLSSSAQSPWGAT